MREGDYRAVYLSTAQIQIEQRLREFVEQSNNWLKSLGLSAEVEVTLELRPFKDHPQGKFERAAKGERVPVKGFKVVPVAEEVGGAGEFISLPLAGLATKVQQYVSERQKGETAKWCKCVWVSHPDDEQVGEGECRLCLETADRPVHMLSLEDKSTEDEAEEAPEKHRFRGRRLRLMQDHPLCPVHTAEGMILGFIAWSFPDDERLQIPNMIKPVGAQPPPGLSTSELLQWLHDHHMHEDV